MNSIPISEILLIIFAYGMKYIVYTSLVLAVITTFTQLVIIYMTVWGDDVSFLQYLSFTLPIDAVGNAKLGIDDVMRVFNFFTLLFMVLFESSRAIKRKLWPSDNIVFKSKAINFLVRYKLTGFIIITLIFVVAGFVCPSEGNELGDLLLWYGVNVFMYLMAIISYAVYTIVNILADRILNGAISEIKSKKI